jgi:soluble lytic murein transglycosylase
VDARRTQGARNLPERRAPDNEAHTAPALEAPRSARLPRAGTIALTVQTPAAHSRAVPALAPLVAALALVLATSAAGGAPEDELPPSARRAAAALGAAREARAIGAHEEAARRFAEAAGHEPAVAAHAQRLAAQEWLAAERPAEAEAAARRGLEAGAGPALAAELLDLAAQARAAVGDEAAARAAWQQALAGDPTPERRQAIGLALGDLLVRAEALDAAAQVLLPTWRDAPECREAEAAGQRLASLEARLGRPLRSASDHLRRAERLFELQRSEAALESYDAALAAGLAPPERDRARTRRAHCLFRLRRYSEAEAAFASLGSDPEARVWHARSLARAGAVEEAIASLEQIGSEPLGENAAWARYLAGLLHDGRGRRERAVELWRSVAEGGASPDLASDARWRLAWSAYRAGDRGAARAHFLALEALESDPVERAGARYWAARALEAEDRDRAATELAALAREMPLGYYGWRAGLRVGAVPAASGEPLARGRAALDGGALLPARVLVAGGCDEAARLSLRGLDDRAAGVDDRIALGRLHAAAGDWASAQALVVRAYGERLARPPAPGEEEIWRLAWPRAWSDELRAALPPDARVAPELVLALMREESGYRHDVVSVSGAVGLLQLMPATASQLAAELGLAPPAPAALAEPGLNLRLGALYLDRLVRRFDGAIAPAVASYNAGPDAVAEWLVAEPGPDDEWVESIPYAETRGYVKRVLRSLHALRTLHR